jgi:hypothetical protein
MVRTCHTLVVKMQRQIEQARDALIVGLELLGGVSSSNVIPARLHGPIHVPQGETRYQRDHTSTTRLLHNHTTPRDKSHGRLRSRSTKTFPMATAIGRSFDEKSHEAICAGLRHKGIEVLEGTGARSEIIGFIAMDEGEVKGLTSIRYNIVSHLVVGSEETLLRHHKKTSSTTEDDHKAAAPILRAWGRYSPLCCMYIMDMIKACVSRRQVPRLHILVLVS